MLRVIILILCLFLVACPPKVVKKGKRLPEKRGPAVEVTRPASTKQKDLGANTPQRRASERTVEKGIDLLEAENYDRALELFQEAANIDASNGVAYYYLAAANARLEQKDVAEGLLEKAEALLKGDEDWMERIDELRKELGVEQSAVVPLPKVVDEY